MALRLLPFMANSKQIVLPHDSSYSLVVHLHSLVPQLGGDSPVAIAPAMLHDDRLNRRSQRHLLFSLPPSLQVTIKPSPAYPRQLTHPLDTQVALQRHPCSYFVVDALSPGRKFCRRRAPTLCKARLKKSTSRVLFASSRFSLRICLRRINSRDWTGGGLVSSNLPRQL